MQPDNDTRTEGFCYLLERWLCYDGLVGEFESTPYRKTDDDPEQFDATGGFPSCPS